MTDIPGEPRAPLPLVLLVCGLSGAGKSVAINALEDLGFKCIDNLPLDLVEVVQGYYRDRFPDLSLAFGIDIRNFEASTKLDNLKQNLQRTARVQVVFCLAMRRCLQIATLSHGGDIP
jgi:RNase adapter protein RapZ